MESEAFISNETVAHPYSVAPRQAGFEQPESKDPSSKILHRPKCASGKSLSPRRRLYEPGAWASLTYILRS